MSEKQAMIAEKILKQVKETITSRLACDLTVFRPGTLFLITPVSKEEYFIPDLEKKIHKAVVEEKDLAFPWDKLTHLERNEHEIFVSSNTDDPVYLGLFGWRYSFANKKGAVGVFSSYFEDRASKSDKKYFDIHRALRRCLLFLKFCQKYMENINAQKARIDFMAFGTENRILRSFPNTFQVRDYECDKEEIRYDFIFKKEDSILDQTKKFGIEIARFFQVSNQFLEGIQDHISTYFKDLIFKHEIS